VHHEAVSALTRLNACQPHEPVARPRELGVVAHRARQGGDGFALVGDVVVECYDQSVRILHHLGAPEVTGSRADVVLNGDDHQLAVHQADQLLSFLLGVPCALADRSLGGYRQIPCNVAAVGLLEQDGTQALFESREAFVGSKVAGDSGHTHRYVRKGPHILRIAGDLKRRGLLLRTGSDGSIPTATVGIGLALVTARDVARHVFCFVAAQNLIIIDRVRHLRALAMLPRDHFAYPLALLQIPNNMFRVARGIVPILGLLDSEMFPNEAGSVPERPIARIPGALCFQTSISICVFLFVIRPDRPHQVGLHEEQIRRCILHVAVPIDVYRPATVDLPGMDVGLHEITVRFAPVASLIPIFVLCHGKLHGCRAFQTTLMIAPRLEWSVTA